MNEKGKERWRLEKQEIYGEGRKQEIKRKNRVKGKEGKGKKAVCNV